MSLTIGSLFSGIGGLELGLEWAGLGPTVWQVENNEYCRRVLAKHWPDADRSVTDVEQAGSENLGRVDLICGGFPCQDVSSAGKGAGLAGRRSGLWYEFARVVDELRPPWIVVENVASGAIRWVDAVCLSLEQQDYETIPIPLSACDVGALHIRNRVFVVAHTVRPRRREIPRGTCGDEARDEQENHNLTLGSHENRQRKNPIIGACEEQNLADVDKQRGEQRGTEPWGSKAKHPETVSSNWWSTEPDVVRVVHGVPHGVDRRRTLGNAVVPQCAEVIGWIVRELMR